MYTPYQVHVNAGDAGAPSDLQSYSSLNFHTQRFLAFTDSAGTFLWFQYCSLAIRIGNATNSSFISSKGMGRIPKARVMLLSVCALNDAGDQSPLPSYPNARY